MVIREGETLADVKMRIQKKLQVSDEEFLKVHIFLCTCFTLAEVKMCIQKKIAGSTRSF